MANVTPGSSSKLNSVTGVSGIINLGASNFAAYMNTVFKAGFLIKTPDNVVLLTNGTDTLATLTQNPLVDQVLTEVEKYALNQAYSSGVYTRASGGVVVHGANGKIDDGSLNFVNSGKIVASYLDDYIDATGKFKVEALPDTARAGVVYVDNYAALSTLTTEQTKSIAYVIDATDDPSGDTKSGGALYAYTSGSWVKIAEPESLDIDISAIETAYDNVEAAGAVMANHPVLITGGDEADVELLDFLAI